MLQLNKVRSSFAMYTQISNANCVDRAKHCLKWFLKTNIIDKKFNYRLYRTYKTINYIGSRVREKIVFKLSKGSMVHLIWAHVAEKFRNDAHKLGDMGAIKISKAIDRIPDSIRNYVIKEYSRRVHFVNGINYYKLRI